MNIKELLTLTYQSAKLSPDPSNQNGALLFDCDGQIISTGNNCFSSRLDVTEDMLTNREKKLFYIEHAERNAIYSAVKRNAQVCGSTMVCQWFACSDCSRAIALCGISRVIGHKQRMDQTPDRWKASVDAGLKYLTDHGVDLEFYDGKIGCEPIIVNGELWYP